MRIGFIIGRIGGVDGVALETEKWIHVLNRMGHETYVLSGRYEEREQLQETEDLLPQLFFFSPECELEQKQAYFLDYSDLHELLAHIEEQSNLICWGIEKWAEARKLDVLISENASALPCHIAMGLGIKKAAHRLGLKTITHDHDFAWERGDRYLSIHPQIDELVAEVFPLRLPNSRHAVINLNARETLKTRYGRDSVVVPNVMNFDEPYGLKTEFNSTLLHDLGLDPDDVPLFQVTRVVRRKGLEVAIELLDRMKNGNVKLVITGSHRDDAGGDYYDELVALVRRRGLSDRVLFAADRFGNKGRLTPDGTRIYSLSDAYAHARACTYFSTYEGFGNAFLECILARKPIFVNNYKPVYWPDIGSKGFRTVMLEDNILTDEAVAEMEGIIHDDQLCEEIAEHNFELGRQHFSYDALEAGLRELLED